MLATVWDIGKNIWRRGRVIEESTEINPIIANWQAIGWYSQGTAQEVYITIKCTDSIINVSDAFVK